MANLAPTALEVARRADLRGRRALITGASSGIGIETARALAAAGADLILGVRDPAKAEPIADEIRGQSGRTVDLLPLDLCDFRSVQNAADVLRAGAFPLELLICNAGASKTPTSHQDDGLDVRFAGNHLGHFLLANLLHPLMAARGARIVMLSSAAHRGRPICFEDPAWTRRPHDEFAAYGESKTANILFAIEASRRWGEDNIFANAVLPGTIMTGLQRYHGAELKRRMGFLEESGQPNSAVKSVEHGAATSVWAAIAPDLEGRGGLVLEDCALARPHEQGMHAWSGYDPSVLDDRAAERLWELSRDLLAALGFPLHDGPDRPRMTSS